jgi:phage terminase large subunit-like protein
LGRTSTGWIAPACGWRTHSITSSAVTSRPGGTVRPSAFAAFRSRTRTWWTARSGGTDKLRAALAFAGEQKQRLIAENALAYYRPYQKQEQFHAAGATYRERLLMAANQSGKTLAGGMEAAAHATGRYPNNWKGYRFDGPNIGWTASVTGETVRDTVQRTLIGRAGQEGTGSMPKECIVDMLPSRGVPELLDIIRVRHLSGCVSTIGLKSYEKGREKWQGETLDWVWFDGEPPPDVYSEGLTRTNVGNKPVWMTFTPLLGMSETVRRFLLDKSPDRHVTTMVIDDAQTSPQERERIIASYRAHEREARTKGVPTLGSGRVFPVAAPPWWNGFWLGSPVCGGGNVLGS